MLKNISSLLASYLDCKDDQLASRSKISCPKNSQDCFDFISLIKQWPQIVGSKMARYSSPLKNTHHTLTVLVTHSVFANELSFMEEVIKQKIFKIFPQLRPSIKRIKFQVSSGSLASPFENRDQISAKKSPPALHPYSVEYREIIEEACELFADISDIDLKNILTSLFIQQRNQPKNKPSS